MYERFTDDVRRAVVLAEEEARGLGHPELRPEHLVIGLLAEREGPAAAALFEMGLSLDVVRSAVQAEAAPGGQLPDRLPFDPATKNVLEEALRQAVRSASGQVNGVHVLLAIVAEADSLGSELLSRAAGGRQAARRAVGGLPDPARFAAYGDLGLARPTTHRCEHPTIMLIAEPATIDSAAGPVEVTIVRCRHCQQTVSVLPRTAF